jgi:hypothetical protein
MIRYLKNKLLSWLGINDLIIDIANNRKDLNKILRLIKVSVDYHHYKGNHSWAVICLPGKKMDYVTFVELPTADIIEIQNFLRQFRKHEINPIIDRMPGMPRESFY